MRPGAFAKTTPDKPVIIMAGSGEVVTYRELEQQSIRLARVFREAGLVPGDRVAILMDNDPHYLTVCLAAERSGLYYVPVNWHLTDAEMRYILDDSGAKALVANAGCGEQAALLRRHCPSLRLALSAGPVDGFDELTDAMAGQPAGEFEEGPRGGDILYTSGTTGRPKGGVSQPSRLVAGKELGEHGATLGAMFGIDERAIYLVPGAPLYHAAPLRFAIAMSQLGATNVIMESFDAERSLAALERYGVTHSQWVPTMFVRLLRLPEQTRLGYDLSSHQMAIHAAAPCPISVKERMIAWWGPILDEYYGASEGGGVTKISSAEWLGHRGSVGKAAIGKIHILGEDGVELPAGEVGVVHFEGGRPIEYLNDPAKTKAVYNDRGWAGVGDLGYLDEERYLYLVDRLDHMIISGGVNIYPQESEDVLIRHRSVSDVAVIGVPNDEYGEEVRAVVQLVDGARASAELGEELLRFCRDSLTHYKCPRSIDFVDVLPRAPSGKLYKRKLRDRYWEDHPSRRV